MEISIMKLSFLFILAGGVIFAQSSLDGLGVFSSKCQFCHTTDSSKKSNQNLLLGPSIEDVMFRVKERYPIREDAVKFIKDYILNPSIDKAICPSIDRYGLMPSMKSVISEKDANDVANMLFDTFPRNIIIEK